MKLTQRYSLLSIPYSDITSSVTEHLFGWWQQYLWHNLISNKLNKIYPILHISVKHFEAQLTCC